MLQSNQKIIGYKVGLLNLAEELGNVSKACRIMGLSRDTFYRYRDAVEEGGVEALLERARRGPKPIKRSRSLAIFGRAERIYLPQFQSLFCKRRLTR